MIADTELSHSPMHSGFGIAPVHQRGGIRSSDTARIFPIIPKPQAPTRDELIERYIPLVDRIVNKIARTLPNHIEVEDLRSIGTVGMMHAIERYDPKQEETFNGYVALRVRGSILDELRRLDCLPRSSRAKARRLQNVSQQLEQALGRAPTEQELCEALKISAAEYQKLIRQTRTINFVSLDSAPGDGNNEDTDLHQAIPDTTQEMSYERLEKQELKEMLVERIRHLPDRQQKILAMYYHEGLRLSEIAHAYGVTEARICQIHSQAVGSLRRVILASYQQ